MSSTSRPTLHQLGTQHGTDKAFHHGYCDFYDVELAGLRDTPLRFLEIGVFGGASARMWLDYFTNVDFHCIDIDPNLAAVVPRAATFHHVDCHDRDALATFASTNGSWDIILDDGSHTMWGQQLTLANLWSRLNPGGLYIIEDLHTSFGYWLTRSNDEGIATTFSMLQHLRDGTPFASPAIDASTLATIRAELASTQIWQRTPGCWDHSVTCVLRKGGAR